ncbi:MAG TPA: ATPase [Actinomycetota bacterium]|nr:ATPase [Actinomycetota bacterium]
MDIAARIHQLEELIREAKSMPLSASVLVNKDEVLELVDGMRNTLPEEIKQARWVVKDREELLAKARRDAEAIVEEARKEQGRLVSEDEVVAESAREAERILSDARDQARQIKLEAEDYVDTMLASFESTLTKTQERLAKTRDLVERGRERLRGTIAEEYFASVAEADSEADVEGPEEEEE